MAAVVITGAAGALGSTLARRLAAGGWDLVLLDLPAAEQRRRGCPSTRSLG